MDLTQEQIESFKKQIIQQIETTFPEDRKASSIDQVNSMGNEEFIEFLKKNNLIKADSENTPSSQNQGQNPFRMIIEGKIPSYVIEENKTGMAVLEINPISKGHTIIIPKKEVSRQEKIPKSAFTLAKNISKRIEKTLNPKNILIVPSNILGEFIINLLPVYSDESLESPRKKAEEEELLSVKNLIEKKPKPKVVKRPQTKKIKETTPWFPKRIP